MEHTTTTTRLDDVIRCSWCEKPAVTIHRSGTLLCTFHATLFIPRTGNAERTPAPVEPREEDDRAS